MDTVELSKLTGSTIGHYQHNATDYRDGTWGHDVSQNRAALVTALGDKTPCRILDFGCGPDTWTELLQQAQFEPIEHYYRPKGLPRHQQPWFVSVWRKK
jgi:hypothetical protein